MSEKRPAEDEPYPLRRYCRIRLESPPPKNSDGSDTESIHSSQNYETEYVKDTSDTSSSPILNIEYEPIDTEEPKMKYYLSDDSDDHEDIAKLGGVFDCVNSDNLDAAILGDTSEENSTSPTSNSDVDPGLPRNDYLDFEKCLLCETDKKDISFPYCSECFTWKKNIFPSRPKNLKKIVKRSKRQLVNSNGGSNTSNSEDNRSEINSTENKNLGRESSSSEGFCENSFVGSSVPQESEDTVDGPSQGSRLDFSQKRSHEYSQKSLPGSSIASSEGPSQRSSQGSLERSQLLSIASSQGSSQVPSIGSSRRPSQGSLQGTSQGSSQVLSIGSSQGPSQRSSQVPSIASSQGSSQGPSQKSSQALSIGSSQGPSQESLQGPSQGSSQTPSIASSQGPSQGSSQGPSQEYLPAPLPGASISIPSTSNTRISLGTCRVCFVRPENGIFVHLNIVHLYGCYSCAKKIWYHNGGCPICRRKIFKVAKLFV